MCDGAVREYNSENNKIFYFGSVIGIMYLIGDPQSITSNNKKIQTKNEKKKYNFI